MLVIFDTVKQSTRYFKLVFFYCTYFKSPCMFKTSRIARKISVVFCVTRIISVVCIHVKYLSL